MWTTAWYFLGDIDKVSSFIDIDENFIDSPATIMWKYKKPHTFGSCEYTYSKDLKI